MQVPRAHEASLGWVSVYPPKNHHVLALTELHDFLLVVRLAGVARAGLLGDDEMTDKERVVDGCAAEDATHL